MKSFQFTMFSLQVKNDQERQKTANDWNEFEDARAIPATKMRRKHEMLRDQHRLHLHRMPRISSSEAAMMRFQLLQSRMSARAEWMVRRAKHPMQLWKVTLRRKTHLRNRGRTQARHRIATSPTVHIRMWFVIRGRIRYRPTRMPFKEVTLLVSGRSRSSLRQQQTHVYLNWLPTLITDPGFSRVEFPLRPIVRVLSCRPHCCFPNCPCWTLAVIRPGSFKTFVDIHRQVTWSQTKLKLALFRRIQILATHCRHLENRPQSNPPLPTRHSRRFNQICSVWTGFFPEWKLNKIRF